jgi:NAD(P)-dependent dehydrogenase (short-subunit alcohol dehydrogenase family)
MAQRSRSLAGRVVIISSMGGMLTAYGLGACCASKHELETAVRPPTTAIVAPAK